MNTAARLLGCFRSLSIIGWGITLPIGTALNADPLSPSQELTTFKLADPRLSIELVASEPEISSPVAMTWDTQGRLFVAEMLDYPTGSVPGRVRMLQDRDGDGRYETSQIFAEPLAFPSGVLPWKDGILVTSAPDILFFRDADGDGKAEERTVLLTGFGEGNQQLRVNGLFWGLDGWVYGANGRSDGEIHGPSDFRIVSLRGHDFRFRPETAEIETLAGRSQFGTARDDWGNRFLSWNTIPIRHDAIPERYLGRNPRLAAGQGLVSLLPADDDSRVFPTTPTPKTFNQESTQHFNALGGLSLYRGSALPREYYGNAFMGETLRNLVHRRVLQPTGGSFVAKRAEKETEFLTSSDPWFHPVNFATGPDGALYVADFYRQWVEHPGFVPEHLRGSADWRTGADHGRIWRIRRKDASPPVPGTGIPAAATPAQLVALLDHPNSWQRDTALRLILERKDRSVLADLQGWLTRSNSPTAQVAALQGLEALGGLEETNLVVALAQPNPWVRATAVTLSESRLASSPILQRRVASLAKDRNERVRLNVALAAGSLPPTERVDALYQVAQASESDSLTLLALRSSVGDRPWPLLEQIMWGDRAAEEATARRLEFLGTLGTDVGTQGPDQDRASLLSMLVNFRSRGINSKHVVLLSGLVRGWGQADPSWLDRFKPLLEPEERQSWFEEIHALATTLGGSTNAPEPARSSSLYLLARTRVGTNAPAIHRYLTPSTPETVQLAAAHAFSLGAQPDEYRELFKAWKGYPPRIRQIFLNSAVQKTELLIPLLDALDAGTVAPTELSPTHYQTLSHNRVPELAQRLQALIASRTSADRAQVIARYTPSASKTGNAKTGSAVFTRNCATCHTMLGSGHSVGPDLSGLGGKSKEGLLVDILDPSRQVASDFVSYTVTNDGGDTLEGLLTADSPAGITLRRAGAPDEIIPRERIRELRASGKSLMPEGLETAITEQEMSDLLEFLTHPDRSLLP